MNNKDILNEGFFKRKKSYADELASKMPQYDRVGAPGNPTKGFTSVDTKDVNELKKRLTGGLGVIMGGNNVRTMAQKSIKTFPIIVSEDVDASTALMIKNALEIRYAELLNQIISNQIIDITQFDKDSDRNIAIQAVDKIIGSGETAANKAYRGKLSVDDIAGNMPLYSLFRQESVDYGDDVSNAILENALVIDSKNVDRVVKLLKEDAYSDAEARYTRARDIKQAKYNDITKLKSDIETLKNAKNNETDAAKKDNIQTQINQMQIRLGELEEIYEDDKKEVTRLEDLLDEIKAAKDYDSIYSSKNRKNLSSNRDEDDMEKAFKRGVVGVDADGFEKVEQMLSADVVLDKKLLSKALNKSIADVLRGNDYLRDRFEKATYLLQSSLISGMEYAEYLKHLGIPVRKEVERDLLINFPMSGVDFGTVYEPVKASTAKDKYGKFVKDQLKHNQELAYERAARQKKVLKVVSNITSAKAGDIIKAGAVGAGIGGGISIAALALISALTGPVGWAAGAIAGAGAIGAAIGAAFRKAKGKRGLKIKAKYERYEGWQRVEEMIQQMDDNNFALSVEAQKEIFRHGGFGANSNKAIQDKAKAVATAEYFGKEKNYFDTNELKKDISGDYGYEASGYIAPTVKEVTDFKKALAKVYNESVAVPSLKREDMITFTESEIVYNKQMLRSVVESYDASAQRREVLTEKFKVSTTVPVQLVNKSIDYNDKLNSVVPSFGTKDVVGYGSVEFDRRELKNRRFMQPLVMTVRFKERYADGKFADNELTAVIGVLGVITYVPTEEMKYILSSNASGKGISGFITGDNNKNSLGDLLANIKGKLDYSKLKQSADVWNDLEKVSELAIANKIAGKSTANLANTHIVFSTRELDDVRRETGVDYIRDMKSASGLMKRYSAMTLMAANDTLERVYMLDDVNARSWVIVPYAEFRGKDSGEQLAATIANSLR